MLGRIIVTHILSYAHPPNMVIKRFKIKEILLHYADLDGIITIQTDGDIISIKKKGDKNYY